ncbi:MAG: hypothetical protein MJ107_02825 [Lachnospiraceae bacterium]|nr:hypothetical protein [Lachnospiraceae bacterium]
MGKTSEKGNSKPNLILQSLKKPAIGKNVLVALWIIFSLGFVLFMMKTGRVNYETNDDVIMAQITAGVFGKHSPYNVFSNIVLGLILMGASMIMPGQNWPTLMDFCFIALSYVMVGVICIKSSKKANWLSVIVPLTFVMATFKTLIMGINFSKVGAIMFMTGFLVLMLSIDTENYKNTENKIIRIIGYIMFISGSLVRLDSLKAMLPFIVILTIYFCIKHKSEFKGNFVDWPILGKLVHVLIPCAAVALLWIVNIFVYNTPEWKAYNNYENLIINMQDFYGFPDYAAHQSEYEELGLNEHDSIMFKCYVHADNKVFSMDVIEKLDEMAARDFERDFSFAYIKQLIQSVLYLACNQTVIMIVLMLFISGAFIVDRRYLPYMGAAICLMLAELGYLYYINRVLERSFILPVIGAFLTLLYIVAKNNLLDSVGDEMKDMPREENQAYKERVLNNIESQRTALIIVVLCIMLFAFFTRGMSDIKDIPTYATTDKESLENLSNELIANSDKLYIWDYQSYVDAAMQYASPFDEYPVNWMGNSLVLGAWPVELPLMREIAEPFGDPGNLMEILATNPNAYYVFEHDNPYMTVAAIEEFLQDHYSMEASLVEEKTIGGYTVYSIR